MKIDVTWLGIILKTTFKQRSLISLKNLNISDNVFTAADAIWSYMPRRKKSVLLRIVICLIYMLLHALVTFQSCRIFLSVAIWLVQSIHWKTLKNKNFYDFDISRLCQQVGSNFDFGCEFGFHMKLIFFYVFFFIKLACWCSVSGFQYPAGKIRRFGVPGLRHIRNCSCATLANCCGDDQQVSV